MVFSYILISEGYYIRKNYFILINQIANSFTVRNIFLYILSQFFFRIFKILKIIFNNFGVYLYGDIRYLRKCV